MNFVDTLNAYARWRDANNMNITRVTISVTEKYARSKLRIPKDAPLAYKGMDLNCIGSQSWRNEQHRLKEKGI